MSRLSIGRAFAAALLLSALIAPAGAQVILAAASQEGAAKPEKKQLSPAEKMNNRFPQPVRVGDLVGLAMLDNKDSTLGFIQQVVRAPSGKIMLVVNYRAWLAWAPLDWGKRPVGVPLEAVAILGRQVAALDMSREEFDGAPTFAASQAVPLAPDDTIRIAITRR